MSHPTLTFDDVTYCYPSSTEPVFANLTVQLAAGWTGIIGANGAGKTTLLRLAVGELAPTRGRIIGSTQVAYCPQRTDDPPAGLPELLAAHDAHACSLRGQLAVGDDWYTRWSTLSHGERKRAQLAVALTQQPDVLALDEPTNHIDMDAAQLLSGALQRYRGIGLLVSHDRHLLNQLCTQCLLVEPPDVVLRPGGYTAAMALAEADAARARREYTAVREEVARLQRAASDRRRAAAAADKKRSKSKISPKDHDAKERIDRARVSGKDGQAGRVLRQMQGRVAQARQQLAGLHAKPQRAFGLTVDGRASRRDFLVRVPAGRLPLHADRTLAFPDLAVTPEDRIALVGPNGGGKSTLIRHIVERIDLPAARHLYIPQEIGADDGAALLCDIRQLPGDELGQVMTVVSCLGSDAERVLDTERPSPGELRKVLLARGVASAVELIIMDEPTNHLDVMSIECVESALAESAAALLLVSHDGCFLRNLVRTVWRIDKQGVIELLPVDRAL
jgi:macrolide transport system ATP-binding/permease protein